MKRRKPGEWDPRLHPPISDTFMQVSVSASTGGVLIELTSGRLWLAGDEAVAASDALDDAIVIATGYLDRDSGASASDVLIPPEPLSELFVGAEFIDGWSAVLSETSSVTVARDGTVKLTRAGDSLIMHVTEAFDVADGLDRLFHR